MNLNVSNTVYDFLNALVRVILPSIGTLYFGLSQIWGLPKATEVVGTIVIICTFLGVVIALARAGWRTEDTLLIDDRDPEMINFGFESGKMFDDLRDGQPLTINVKKIEQDFTEPLHAKDVFPEDRL